MRSATGSVTNEHPTWVARDRIIVLSVAGLLQVLFLLCIVLGFECDAATFYAYAKALVGAPGGVLSSARPPLYPLFLVLTGAVWPGTFAFTVLAQAVMGVATSLLVYRILRGAGRWAALTGAFGVIAAMTPFMAAKLILSEQLHAFLTVLTVFFLARYVDGRRPQAMYGFAIAGTAAMLTRWEAEFIVLFGWCAIVALACRKPRQVRQFATAVGAVIVVLASYSVARAQALGDPRLIGSVQSGTGAQLFLRMYGLDPRDVGWISSSYLRSRMPGAIASNSASAVPRFVHPSNGPATQELRDLVVRHVGSHPESFRNLKPLLAQMVIELDAPAVGPYEELFGRFDGNAPALADYIFESRPNLRTAQYPLYLDAIVQQELGPAAGDQLLLRAGLESVVAYPVGIFSMIADGFTLTGLSLEGIAAVGRHPLAARSWRWMFPLWGISNVSHIDFNLANCAAAALPASMMAEYRLDHGFADNSVSRAVIRVAALLRNLTRVVCGTLLVFGWWLLFLGRRRALTLPVLATLACLIVTIGVGSGGGNGKYDTGFMPLLVVAAVSIAAEAAFALRRVRHARRVAAPTGVAL